jgi:pectinesterase
MFKYVVNYIAYNIEPMNHMKVLLTISYQLKTRIQQIALLFFAFFLNSSIAFAQDPKYPSELTVAKDGTGNYQTIQEAINSVRDLGLARVTIHIKKGIYPEKLIIPSWKTRISLIGDDKESTIITGADYSGKVIPTGKDGYGNAKFSTFTSFTFLVQGDDITLENLTIENTSGRVGQAVALHVEGNHFIIKNCKLLGNQDTLYTAKTTSRQFYQNCLIEGTTDFIFGEATVVFQNCTIKSKADSYVTAAATGKDQRFGYVFINCSLVADSGVTKVFLGRPWRPYAKTVFINCNLGAHIVSAGWNPWKGDLMFPNKEKTAFYAEFQSSGPGANPGARVNWSKQLSASEAKQYTVANIFN